MRIGQPGATTKRYLSFADDSVKVVTTLKRCLDCGAENSDLNEYCSKCSAKLPRALNMSPIPPETGSRTRPSPEIALQDSEKALRPVETGVDALRNQMYSHRCGVAAVLSTLLPGLGQIYAQRVVKGMVMLTAWAVGGFFYVRWVANVAAATIRWRGMGLGSMSNVNPWHYAVGLLFVGFWIYAIFDAASAPERA